MDPKEVRHAALSASELIARARALIGKGEFDRAIEAGERAVELDPSSTEAHLALGAAYRNRGALRMELELWQRRCASDPSDPEGPERVGWILWFTGHPDDALPWLERAAALRPTGEWANFYIGNAHLARRDYAAAEGAYRRTIELHPSHSSAHAGVGWTLLASGRDEEARSWIERIQASTLDGDRYYVKIADLELFAGQPERALEHARHAVADAPEARYWPRGVCATTIVGAAVWSKDRTAAEAALKQSVAIDRARLDGGDEGHMPRYDLAAVTAIRGDATAGCHWLAEAAVAGWRYPDLARRDPLLRGLEQRPEFHRLIA